MAKDGKLKPIEWPELYAPLWETLDKSLADVDVRSKFLVELRVSGGMPSQAYYFHFRASGAGTVQCAIRSVLHGREGRREDASLDQRDWMMLLETIHTSGVLGIPQEAPRFLPDTVVGYLEISDGKSTHRVYFAADEEQATVQAKVPPPELIKVVDTIYQLGSKLLDMPSVKP
jgi:hypothetical protein